MLGAVATAFTGLLFCRSDANGCSMAGWRNRFAALFTVVIFALSLTVCEVACGSGEWEGGVAKTVQHHCLGQCACHGVTIPSIVETPSPFLIDHSTVVFAAFADNSRLIPASIFNPPRV